MEGKNESKHTPEEMSLHQMGHDYQKRQGTTYPMLPAYIAMVQAQIREAFYSGYEASEKKFAALLEENEKLKSNLEEKEEIIKCHWEAICEYIAEVDRLTKEKSELVEIVEQFIKNIKHVDGGYLYLKVKLRNQAQDILTRIKS